MSASPRAIGALVLMGVGSASAMAQVPATACGVRRWPVKVMLDDDTGRVAKTPVAGTIAALGRVARPDGDLSSAAARHRTR